MTRLATWCSCAAAALTLATPVAHAQHATLEGFNRPIGARRVVALWDFEDALAHLEEVPQHWYRGHDRPPDRSRPGFPAYNAAAFDKSIADTGEVSMKLPTRGGSTSLALAKGVVAALPEGDYVVVSRVRTDGLQFARAGIAAWFLDAQLNEIPGSRKISEPLRTVGEWEDFSVQLVGHPDAAWIQLELLLLQPDQLDTPHTIIDTVYVEDFNGAVWFDEVAILQVPRLEITTDEVGNIHVGEQPPNLQIVAQDLTGESLNARLRIHDIHGEIVAAKDFELSPSGRAVDWTPPLDRFGWYRAELDVSNTTARVGLTEMSFIWAPPTPPMEFIDRQTFGLVLDSVPDGFEMQMRSLIRRMEVGLVNIPVWDASLTLATLDARVDRTGELADLIIEQGTELTFTLAEMPTELAAQLRLDETQILSLFTESEETWGPYIDPLLAVFGERVRRWQVGPNNRNDDFYLADLVKGISATNSALLRLVPRPILAMPWLIHHRLDDRTAALSAATITMPSDAPGDGLAHWKTTWPEHTEITLLINPLPRGEYDPWHAVVALSKKIIRAHEAGVQRIATPELWTLKHRRSLVAMPDPELAMWLTLAHKFAGREVVASLPMPDGVHALVADGQRGGMIIAWNDHAPPKDAVMQGFLAPNPVVVTDIFGNQEYVSPIRGEHTIQLGHAPLIIEGIDTELALLRSNMRIESSFVSSRAQKHEMELVITNPWETNLSGRIKITEPNDWDISPRVQQFTVAPGQERRLPFLLSFGLAEETGPHAVIAEMRLSTERRYPTLRIPLQIEIGLDTVEFSADVRLEDGADGPLSDVVVTVVVQNISDKPQTIQAFVQAHGHAFKRSAVSELLPGQIDVRQIRLDGGGLTTGAQSLINKRIRVGLKEQDGTGRLNQTIMVR